MIRSSLLLLSVATLGISIACQSGQEPDAGTTASAPLDGGATVPETPSGGVMLAAPSVAEEAAMSGGNYPTLAEDATEPFFGYAPNAFPPLLPNTEHHDNPWNSQDCLMCHDNGVGMAPPIVHAGMSRDLRKAACRSCHVQVPQGEFVSTDPTVLGPATPRVIVDGFADNAFPPALPATDEHANAWMRSDCLACHERGIGDAPRVTHAGFSPELMKARCRTCHLPSFQEDL